MCRLVLQGVRSGLDVQEVIVYIVCPGPLGEECFWWLRAGWLSLC